MKMEAGKMTQEIKSLVFKCENLICNIQEPCKKSSCSHNTSGIPGLKI